MASGDLDTSGPILTFATAIGQVVRKCQNLFGPLETFDSSGFSVFDICDRAIRMAGCKCQKQSTRPPFRLLQVQFARNRRVASIGPWPSQRSGSPKRAATAAATLGARCATASAAARAQSSRAMAKAGPTAASRSPARASNVAAPKSPAGHQTRRSGPGPPRASASLTSAGPSPARRSRARRDWCHKLLGAQAVKGDGADRGDGGIDYAPAAIWLQDLSDIQIFSIAPRTQLFIRSGCHQITGALFQTTLPSTEKSSSLTRKARCAGLLEQGSKRAGSRR